MSEEEKPARDFSTWIWPVVVLVVLAVLLGIQMVRVNRRENAPAAAVAPVTYSTPGPLLSGDIKIAAGDFVSSQIRLNRRAKISGEFQTGRMKSRVAVIVIDEADFEKWKQQPNFKGRVGTGYVPAGKINPILEPGSYYLIVDNRANESPLSVQANFLLE